MNAVTNIEREPGGAPLISALSRDKIEEVKGILLTLKQEAMKLRPVPVQFVAKLDEAWNHADDAWDLANEVHQLDKMWIHRFRYGIEAALSRRLEREVAECAERKQNKRAKATAIALTRGSTSYRSNLGKR